MHSPAVQGVTRDDLVIRPDRTVVLYRLTDRLYRARTMAEVHEAALDAITEAMNCRRASVLLFDSAGVMQFVAWRGLSDHYRTTLAGHTPWKPGEHEPVPLFVSDIEETSESRAVKDVIRGEGIRALAFVPLMADGGVIGKFMSYYEDARSFTEEERVLAITVARQVGFCLERTQAEHHRQAAERHLRDSEERFREMTELAPVMMWISDETGRCVHLNRMLREFWGVPVEQLKDFDWRTTMHPEDIEEIGARMFAAITDQTPVQIKGRFRNTAGEFRTLETDARPRFSDGGKFLGFVGVNIDVTDRERAEAQRDLLLAELNHRVKNTLAVVQGVAHQTMKSSKTMQEAKDAFEGRLGALSRAHDVLSGGALERAPLSALVAEVLTGRGMERSRSNIAGPETLLSAKQVQVLAMALHELFTNAVKYGAFANETGVVNVDWTSDGGMVGLIWRESGGPSVTRPVHRGFGSVLLERALRDVDGGIVMDYAPDGLVCRMNFPLA